MDVFGETRGYVLEVYGTHFELPDLGPIGVCLYDVGLLIHHFGEVKTCVNNYWIDRPEIW